MLDIEVGKVYDVSMRGESEFGGPVRVISIDHKLVHTVLVDDSHEECDMGPALFSRHGDKDGHETLCHVPEGNDMFPANSVVFTPIPDEPSESKSYVGAVESGVLSLENQLRWLAWYPFGELTEQEAAQIVKRMASLRLAISRAIKRMAEE